MNWGTVWEPRTPGNVLAQTTYWPPSPKGVLGVATVAAGFVRTTAMGSTARTWNMQAQESGLTGPQLDQHGGSICIVIPGPHAQHADL